MKNTSPVDSYTWDLTHRVLAKARERGADPVEMLHRAGLLLTPQREKDLKADAVLNILVRMQDYRVADFLRRRFKASLEQRTPQDLYNCIVEWLDDMVRATRRGDT